MVGSGMKLEAVAEAAVTANSAMERVTIATGTVAMRLGDEQAEQLVSEVARAMRAQSDLIAAVTALVEEGTA